ncbi:CoA transferase [Gordonia sp. HNM0687]|uniref:CoA transferase n=1 Tax=Gordonia mangrovi TaxID=2665643 RepID=A0A6L7GUR0_9ACTN|nr:CaiB/BaiF CoA-transferase family protein [Gordonia mangrovi]MXP22415.1 CoA transferase [Gordonia mangrovi]UVF77702.1 CoA transferase [Gordonia mangrovi]
MSGPLTGVRVVEMLGLGPTPHSCMMLADLGADVVQIRRPGGSASPDGVPDADAGMWRGRRVVEADLKDADDISRVRELIAGADVLVEGYRPGVMERLGLGPDALAAAAPQLIYARMTGWGQSGSYALAAGHDINYLAVTGLLNAMGPADRPPVPPLSLVADFGGGSMFLVVGVLAALHERHSSGRGQVIDVAMTDGAGVLGALQWSWKAAGRWADRADGNLLDGSAPFYTTYACADGGYIAVGALEDIFWHRLIDTLEVDDPPDRWDRASWPGLTQTLAARFASRTRAEWESVFDGVDACVTPVLDFGESAKHPYATERASYVEVEGMTQPAPAPRFSRSTMRTPLAATSTDVTAVLDEWQGPAGGRR